MSTQDGGPAFPNITPEMCIQGGPGMTLRDYFAAAAMQGLLAQSPCARSAAEFAREAYVSADAMLRAREVK